MSAWSQPIPDEKKVQEKVYFTFKDGKIIRAEPGPFKEINPEPKKRVVMNRPGHVRPLHRRKHRK